jgi:hypothetical protein
VKHLQQKGKACICNFQRQPMFTHCNLQSVMPVWSLLCRFGALQSVMPVWWLARPHPLKGVPVSLAASPEGLFWAHSTRKMPVRHTAH